MEAYKKCVYRLNFLAARESGGASAKQREKRANIKVNADKVAAVQSLFPNTITTHTNPSQSSLSSAVLVTTPQSIHVSHTPTPSHSSIHSPNPYAVSPLSPLTNAPPALNSLSSFSPIGLDTSLDAPTSLPPPSLIPLSTLSPIRIPPSLLAYNNDSLSPSSSIPIQSNTTTPEKSPSEAISDAFRVLNEEE